MQSEQAGTALVRRLLELGLLVPAQKPVWDVKSR